VSNDQQVGLLAYQDDDTYVNLNRAYVDGSNIELFRESAQAITPTNRVPLTNTGNLILRLDRNAATNTYTAYYSTNGGTSWTTLGTTTLVMANPRLGVQVGANLGGSISADLAWVEILP
jgi:hypothetical protein